MKRLVKGKYYRVRVKSTSEKPIVYNSLKYLQSKESNTLLVFEQHLSGNAYQQLWFERKGIEVEIEND